MALKNSLNGLSRAAAATVAQGFSIPNRFVGIFLRIRCSMTVDAYIYERFHTHTPSRMSLPPGFVYTIFTATSALIAVTLALSF